MYKAYVTTLKDMRPHPNADRLLLATCFGNTVCISTDYAEDMLGVYFPEGGQLSEEFCEKNNLVRKKDENGNNVGGYLDPAKRNITAIRLRGEKSEGLFLPIDCFKDYNVKLHNGDVIDGMLNGKEICCKYIPIIKAQNKTKTTNRTRKKLFPIAPLFKEHAETEQLVYNLSDFKAGDIVEFTLKMHGSSGRVGYLPTLKGYKCKNRIYQAAVNAIMANKKVGKYTAKLAEKGMKSAEPIYDWDYVTGSRRVVLTDFDGGFYGSNKFREPSTEYFKGKLWKGETVYFEIVGFTDTGVPIMGSCSNGKMSKEFRTKYGSTTEFSYGCASDGKEKPQNDFYVYRMTMTNADGDIVEYTPDFMRYRCEQMGAKYVPLFAKATLSNHSINVFYPNEDSVELTYNDKTPGELVQKIADKYYDGSDPIGKTHVREGVVVRIVNRPGFVAYKYKNFSFKVLSGIIIDNSNNTTDSDILSEM